MKSVLIETNPKTENKVNRNEISTKYTRPYTPITPTGRYRFNQIPLHINEINMTKRKQPNTTQIHPNIRKYKYTGGDLSPSNMT
jgi:hypothetical protein